jgi:DNA (cytosine-5)-methyltransferase 1
MMLTPQFTLPLHHELVVDNFAGGGGASSGIERAIGRPVDIAINHDPEAVAMHQANHPQTRHLCESVWDVNPREVCDGQPVGLAWFSPDCKHFSKAKGGKPVEKKIRGLAWIALRWVGALKPTQQHPRVIVLENVEEFVTWGPLTQDGRPCPRHKGREFRAFVNALQRLGYAVQWRELRACDYGAPTSRKRLFLVARRDGQPIVWPTPTHGPGRPQPWRTAAQCIDWSLPCPSIFNRPRPLADATLRRVAEGLRRFVIEAAEPFIVRIGHTGHGDAGKVRSVHEPLSTITSKAEHCLVSAFLAKHYTGVVGSDLRMPIGTVTSVDHHSLVAAFLVKFYGSGGQWAGLDEPMHTLPTKDRMGLVTVAGEQYRIVDIGLRMLQPRELARAQGFAESYLLDAPHLGRPLPKHAQVRMIGNSVCPPMAEALVRANFVEQMERREAA